MDRRSFLKIIPALGVAAVLPKTPVDSKEVLRSTGEVANLNADMMDGISVRVDPRCPPGHLYGIPERNYRQQFLTAMPRRNMKLRGISGQH